jgi:2'-5' RNA ligase
LAFGGLGAFPNLKKPRVLFVPVTRGMEDLGQLALKISENLKKAGIAAAENEFYGHVTLGRVKILKGISKTVDSLQANSPSRLAMPHAGGLTLFESQLTPEGSIYHPLQEFPFQIKGNS